MAQKLNWVLCTWCAQRENAPLGSYQSGEGRRCSICTGMFEKVGRNASMAAYRAKRFEYRTFSLGVILPEGMQEREDEFRATMKLMGKETVKSQLARLLGGAIAKETRRAVDNENPDANVLVDLAEETVRVSTRPIYFYARYSKPSGLGQKREYCTSCMGSGCEKCDRSGYGTGPTVESLLRRKLLKITGAGKMKVTWIGSEDPNSLVFPPGRPFIAELKNPVKRSLPRKFDLRGGGGTIHVSRGRILAGKPVRVPTFRFRTEMLCEVGAKATEPELRMLSRAFRGVTVRFDRPHSRPVEKKVYRLKAKMRGRHMLVEATLDGGLPVKRFASGDLVRPSIAEVLKTEVRCRNFDICEVKETGGFSYTEVARI